MVKGFSEAKKISLEVKQGEQVVEQQYEKLKKAFSSQVVTEEGKAKIEKAFQLAQDFHKDTYRKSGEPYIMHPLRVAQIVTEEMGLGTNSILCGLLHDIVEDTSVSINKIKELFGKEVSKIIHGVTKIKKIFAWETSVQAENFRKLLLNLTHDRRVMLIKLADRLDNMRTLSALPRRKQLKIASETIHFYVQIAHRLGLGKIKLELEDLYLKHIYPKTYQDIAKRLRNTRKSREELTQKFAQPIEEALKKQNISYRTEKRAKSIYSIWQKIQKRHIPLEEIYDLIALRIVLTGPLEEEKIVCWKVLGIVSSIYTPHPSRFRDWISMPKSNGYESLHTTVMNTNGQWMEVQIRTERMHVVASKGLAAHWRYKEDKPMANLPVLDIWMKSVEKFLKEQKKATIETLGDVQMSSYEDEINVFTKKGTVKILPKGATVLDFAIEEKNAKALQCTSALVNQKIAPLHQKLSHGDQIEFILDNTQTPKLSWLNFVETPKARRLLKSVFKDTHEAIRSKGKSMVEAALNKLGSSLDKKTAELLREFFDEKTIATLYYKIGSKKVRLEELATFTNFVRTMQEDKSSNAQNTDKMHIDPEVKKLGIVVDGKENYTLAQCCDPIPGEEIFGVVSLHQRIKVHRIDCPNALYILTHQGDKIIKAEWQQQQPGCLLHLAVTALYNEGIRKKIIDTLQAQCRMESIVFKRQKDFIKGEVTIEVKDAAQLNQITQKIQHIQGVTDITRHSASSALALR